MGSVLTKEVATSPPVVSETAVVAVVVGVAVGVAEESLGNTPYLDDPGN